MTYSAVKSGSLPFEMLAFLMGARPGDHGKAFVRLFEIDSCTPKKPVHIIKKEHMCTCVVKRQLEESWKFRKKVNLLN